MCFAVCLLTDSIVCQHSVFTFSLFLIYDNLAKLAWCMMMQLVCSCCGCIMLVVLFYPKQPKSISLMSNNIFSSKKKNGCWMVLISLIADLSEVHNSERYSQPNQVFHNFIFFQIFLIQIQSTFNCLELSLCGVCLPLYPT